MILTILETVAVDSPVCRASSAWVDGPPIRVSMIRCWFCCRRADCDPGFLGLLLVERVVADMLRRLPYRCACSQEVNAWLRRMQLGTVRRAHAGSPCIPSRHACGWVQTTRHPPPAAG